MESASQWEATYAAIAACDRARRRQQFEGAVVIAPLYIVLAIALAYATIKTASTTYAKAREAEVHAKELRDRTVEPHTWSGDIFAAPICNGGSL